MAKLHTIVVLCCMIINSIKCENATGFVNLNVKTDVDLRETLVNIKRTVRFLNVGPLPLERYSYIISHPNADASLHFVRFLDNQDRELKYIRSVNEIENCTTYDIFLDRTLPPNAIFDLVSVEIHANKIKPAQKNRMENEDQLMIFSDNSLYYSQYSTEFLETRFLIKAQSIVAFSEPPISSDKNKLVYGFKHAKPYATYNVTIIFANNNPFLVVKNVKRTIYVSHFGRISIEDDVTIFNYGSKLLGPYSGVFQNGATKWLHTHLPASAENIKFFDTIGNSSKSLILYFNDYITFQFKPRYPLLGGWKTNYVLQYDVAAYNYLYSTSQEYFVLEIRPFDHVLNDVIVEDVSIRIVLPEGADIRKVQLPSGFHLDGQNLSCVGGLCIFGRPTLMVSGRNIFFNHVANAKIAYYFYARDLFRAPLLLICYIQFIFIIVIIGTNYVTE